MDAELKEYLDRMFVAITDQIGRLDQRVERVEHRVDAMHLEFSERFIAMDDRFRSMELRIQQFETRMADRLDRVEAEVLALGTALGRTAGSAPWMDGSPPWKSMCSG